MLYLTDCESSDYVRGKGYIAGYVHGTTDEGLPSTTAKFRRAEHRSFTLLSSVCWNWHQTLTGWPQSTTPRWVAHKLNKLIQSHCTYVYYFTIYVSFLLSVSDALFSAEGLCVIAFGYRHAG